MKKEWKPEIVWLDPKELTPYINNSKIHSDEQIDHLAGSIAEFGFNQPILVDKDKVIVAGHGRREAALRLNMSSVPVVFADHLDENQIKASRIADNKLASLEYDKDKLAFDIGTLDRAGFDLNLTGVGFEDIKELLAIGELQNERLSGDIGMTDEDAVPELAPPRTKPGQIFKLGRHRLICGDSTKTEDIDKLMNGELADMVFTDPPYNVAYEGKTKDALTIENDEMGDEQFFNFLLNAYTAMFKNTKPGGSIYVCHADSEGANFINALKKSGFLLKQCIIWAKNAIVMGRQDYHWQHEPILYGWAPGAAHNWYSDRKQSTLFQCKKPSRNGEHPTMKPVELVEYFVGNSSRTGEIILDPFGGGGSTLIAAEKSGRRANLCEIDPKYCDVIIKRWEDYTGNKSELIWSNE